MENNDSSKEFESVESIGFDNLNVGDKIIIKYSFEDSFFTGSDSINNNELALIVINKKDGKFFLVIIRILI